MEALMQLHPTVCAVGNTYQIMVVTEAEALVSIRVGERVYYNHCNGIRHSAPGVHRFSIPALALEEESSYTVILQKVIERCTYYPKTEPPVEKSYSFRPIRKTTDIHVYHIADVHGEMEQAVGNAAFSGNEIDLLVLNGDIISTCDSFEDMLLSYKITSAVAKGEIPCVIARGNHDLRGCCAEHLAGLMPGEAGRPYYTFRVGCIWGIVLDASEDKEDDYPSYGGMVCCHEFRLEETEWLKETTLKERNFDAEGIKYKLVISHVPISFRREAPFDIEKPLFSEWGRLLRENIKPHLMLSGHTHTYCVSRPGDPEDELGHPCPVVVGSGVEKIAERQVELACASIYLGEESAKVVINTQNRVLDEKTVYFENQ